MTLERFSVLSIGIHACHYSSAIETLFQNLQQGQKGYVTVTGVHGVMESVRNPVIRDVHNQALLNVPDGMPMVWIGKSKGYDISRVYGPNLMLKLCEASVTPKYKHFLYGGNEGVAPQLAQTLQNKFPGISIVGTYTPPFRSLTSEELKDIAQTINESGADFVWVGLSTPKQELFMNALLPYLNKGILLGVGAAFDFHIGAVKQAPVWIQKMGLEWFYRLIKEPKRLWKRYLKNNPQFIYLYFKSLITKESSKSLSS